MRRWFSAAGVAAALVVVVAAAARAQTAARRPAAPAFGGRDLVALPRSNWITNGGNVKDLKALWRTSMGSGATPNNSGQAQILHYEGTLYVINGANDVFALDVVPAPFSGPIGANPNRAPACRWAARSAGA